MEQWFVFGEVILLWGIGGIVGEVVGNFYRVVVVNRVGEGGGEGWVGGVPVGDGGSGIDSRGR